MSPKWASLGLESERHHRSLDPRRQLREWLGRLEHRRHDMRTAPGGKERDLVQRHVKRRQPGDGSHTDTLPRVLASVEPDAYIVPKRERGGSRASARSCSPHAMGLVPALLHPKRSMTRRNHRWDRGVGLTLVASALLACADEPSRISFLLITVDTLRADALGSYGASPSVTPNLDRLASRSTVFENASASMPMTRPSHFSLFTSLYPREHGTSPSLSSGS